MKRSALAASLATALALAAFGAPASAQQKFVRLNMTRAAAVRARLRVAEERELEFVADGACNVVL